MSNRVQTVHLDYVPRKAFKSFHERSARRTVIVAHRRAGKTFSVIQDLIARALNFQKKDRSGKLHPRPRFAYLCPYKGQAKLVAWQYLIDFTKTIPGVKKNETELWVEVPTVTGDMARITLGGVDNPDNLRGSYYDGVVLDEYGDMKPDAYSLVLRPALADRKGWVVFMGTPKGKNDAPSFCPTDEQIVRCCAPLKITPEDFFSMLRMKRELGKRRTDRHTSLNIDVGLIVLPKLGNDNFSAELLRQGLEPETILRILTLPRQRRPAQSCDGTGDRRRPSADKLTWVSLLKFWS